MSGQAKPPENGQALDRAGFNARYMHWQPQVQEVALPDGAKCFVREMSGEELDAWEMSGYERLDDKLQFTGRNARAALVVRCLCSAQGARLYRSEEIGVVGSFPGRVLDAIYQAAKKLNRIGEDAGQAAKNSEAGRTSSSGTGSPEGSAAPSPNASSA